MRFRFALAVFFLLISTGIEVALPLLQGRIIDSLMKSYGKQAMQDTILLFLLAIVLKGLSDGVQTYVVQVLGQNLTHQVRMDLFRRMLCFPVAYFDRVSSGRLVTRVIHDLKSLSELFSASICVAGLDTVVIVASVVAMICLQPLLAVVVLIPIPLAFYLIHRYGERVAASYRIVRSRLGLINGFLAENFGAMASIQRLAGEPNQSGKFRTLVDSHEESQMHALRAFAMAQPIINGTNGITFCLLVIVGGTGVIEGAWTLGILVAFLGYLKNLFQPLRDLIEKYNTFVSARVAFERIFSLFAEKVEFGFVLPHTRAASRALPIEFENVSFSYSEGFNQVLRDASFTVRRGETLAIVGPTGGGKSTIFRLLLGFYPPTLGRILIGGREIRDWNLGELRQSVGLVAQELFLFRGSLRENLSLGNSEWKDSEIEKAMDEVGLWSRVKNRGGLALQLEEAGANLSLGERQLLAMARVFLRNPPILLFDEVTSQIDAGTEDEIIKALNGLRHGRTCLFIAHRPRAAAIADSVIEVREGLVLPRPRYDTGSSKGNETGIAADELLS